MIFFVKPTLKVYLADAECAMLCGDYEGARESFLRALECDPENRKASLGIAECYALAAAESATYEENHQ